MTSSVTAALVVAGILGMSFSSTRPMAIAAVAALTFIYPALVILVIAGAGVSMYLTHFRK